MTRKKFTKHKLLSFRVKKYHRSAIIGRLLRFHCSIIVVLSDRRILLLDFTNKKSLRAHNTVMYSKPFQVRLTTFRTRGNRHSFLRQKIAGHGLDNFVCMGVLSVDPSEHIIIPVSRLNVWWQWNYFISSSPACEAVSFHNGYKIEIHIRAVLRVGVCVYAPSGLVEALGWVYWRQLINLGLSFADSRYVLLYRGDFVFVVENTTWNLIW